MENFDFIQSFLFPYINLAIFLVLAVFVFKKPILNALSGKRETYLLMLDRANKAREDAELKHRELEDRLRGLDAELARMRSEMKIAAEQEAAAIVTSGSKLAEHLKQEARRIAEAEVGAAKEAIRSEILDQVRHKTAEELKRTLDDTRQRQIFKHSLNEVPSIGARP